MDRIEALLVAVDWSRVDGGQLGDNIGPVPSVPRMVRDLWHADPDRRWTAVDFLERAGLQFGQSHPATVPLIPVIVAVLTDARSANVGVASSFDPQLPLRARLLEMLGNAATAPAWGGTDEELRAKAAAVVAGAEDLLLADLIAGEEASARLGVRAMAGDVIDAVVSYIDDQDVRTVHAAIFAVTRFVQLLLPECRGAVTGAGAADRVAVVVQRLRAVAGRGSGVVSVSAAAAFALAELGADTTALLGEPELAVRACAALSPSTADDTRALMALEHALRCTPNNDTWLSPGSKLERMRLYIDFARAASSRARSFNELCPGALVVATPEAESTEAGWGPLLRVAFSPGWRNRPLVQPRHRDRRPRRRTAHPGQAEPADPVRPAQGPALGQGPGR
ncbi:hypothetical protein AB0H83_31935 [Dactylosporangium sp. NPDC050688]|uniref:hypothetical protein n=1 Tax=Dactylosporangium sp. NPDC050688 TaxID=3157217 RepID=UPI0033FE9FBA